MACSTIASNDAVSKYLIWTQGIGRLLKRYYIGTRVEILSVRMQIRSYWLVYMGNVNRRDFGDNELGEGHLPIMGIGGVNNSKFKLT